MRLAIFGMTITFLQLGLSGVQGQAPTSNVRAAVPAPESSARPTMIAHRLTDERPVLNGVLDDVVWSAAPVSSAFVQQQPRSGAVPSERTEVRVLFDDETLYIGARLFDSRPDSIVSILARRDIGVEADQFIVAFDTYRDRRTAFVFRVGPDGARGDWMLTNGRDANYSWDPVWQVKTQRDSSGWSIEMAIPLSQLRFADGAADAAPVWGANFYRRIARRGEWNHWSLIPNDANEEVSHYGELRGVLANEQKRIEFMPYILTQASRAVPGSGAESGLSAAGGADLQVGIGGNLTLTATINPDFGQVEADPSQVNLSGQETLFEERRPFFVEGNDLFQGFFPQMFYSRRIGRFPRGSAPEGATEVIAPRAARVLGAGKLTGKTAEGWSIAVLNATTQRTMAEYLRSDGKAATTEIEPLTNYFVSRIGRETNAGWTRVGVTATAVHRDTDAPEMRFLPDAAYAGGLDLLHRFGDGGSLYLRGTLQGSHVTGDTSAVSRLQRSFFRYYQRPDAPHVELDPTATSLSGYSAFVRLARESGGRLRWGVAGVRRSPGFEINDLGFQFDADINFAIAWVGWEDRTVGKLFRRKTVFLNSTNGWDFGKNWVSSILFARGDMQFANYWDASFFAERWLGGYDPRMLRGGPSVRREPGGLVRADLNSDRRKAVYTTLGLTGQSYDESGTRSGSIAPGVVVRPTAGSELAITPSIAWNNNPTQFVGSSSVGGARYWVVGRVRQTTAAITARASYTFSPALSLQAYAQPFISAARYDELAEVAHARAHDIGDRFRRYAISQVQPVDERRRIDRDGDGAVDFYVDEPDFSVRELNANAVLRWEYRPGSTAFFVWSHGRSSTTADGSFDLASDANRLFDLPSRNTFLVKLSYWVN